MLPRIRGTPYVFPGSKEAEHFVGLPKIWARIRKEAGLEDVRVHNLWHSFASVGALGGDTLLMNGKLPGHQNTETTARYTH
jgi:site-specific recombinase XerD